MAIDILSEPGTQRKSHVKNNVSSNKVRANDL